MGIEQFIVSMCVQTAVYWGSPATDGRGGGTFADPVEIKVRWDFKNRVLLSPDGKEVNADVEVLTPEDLEYSGILYLGTLASLLTLGLDIDSGETYPDPKDVVNAYEILTITKVSMPKSLTQYVRTVNLSRYKT